MIVSSGETFTKTPKKQHCLLLSQLLDSMRDDERDVCYIRNVLSDRHLQPCSICVMLHHTSPSCASQPNTGTWFECWLGSARHRLRQPSLLHPSSGVLIRLEPISRAAISISFHCKISACFRPAICVIQGCSQPRACLSIMFCLCLANDSPQPSLGLFAANSGAIDQISCSQNWRETALRADLRSS